MPDPVPSAASYAGGCLCGAVRIECRSEPYRVGICHCLDCRKHSGSLFAILAIFPLASVTVTGTTAHHQGRHFCPACGSPLFTHTAGAPTAYVKAGAFDDPALVRPALEIWTQSRVPWAQVPEGLEHHPRDRNG